MPADQPDNPTPISMPYKRPLTMKDPDQPDLDAAVETCRLASVRNLHYLSPRDAEDLTDALCVVLDALDKLRQPAPSAGFQPEQLNPSLADLQKLLAAEPAPADDPLRNFVANASVISREQEQAAEMERVKAAAKRLVVPPADPAALAREMIERQETPHGTPEGIRYLNFRAKNAVAVARWALERDAAAKDAEAIRDGITDALESAGYFHMSNAEGIGMILKRIRDLEAELARVAPFLAAHGVEGYTVEAKS